MNARALHATDWPADDVASVGRARLRARSRRLALRLAVLGLSVPDVVEAAGGWLFDRAAAGWDVTVIAGDISNTRPLRILGANVLSLECVLRLNGHGPYPQALAVATDVYRNNERIRHATLDAIHRGCAEVVLWGQIWPSELDGVIVPTEHRLSIAARAFKAHALTAAGITGHRLKRAEVFRTASSPGTAAIPQSSRELTAQHR